MHRPRCIDYEIANALQRTSDGVLPVEEDRHLRAITNAREGLDEGVLRAQLPGIVRRATTTNLRTSGVRSWSWSGRSLNQSSGLSIVGCRGRERNGTGRGMLGETWQKTLGANAPSAIRR